MINDVSILFQFETLQKFEKTIIGGEFWVTPKRNFEKKYKHIRTQNQEEKLYVVDMPVYLYLARYVYQMITRRTMLQKQTLGTGASSIHACAMHVFIFKGWVSFCLGSWGMTRSAGQTNRVNSETVLGRFVYSTFQLISHAPRKKTLEIILCINHCACDLSKCRTTCWHCLSGIELKNLSRVQRRKYDTVVNIYTCIRAPPPPKIISYKYSRLLWGAVWLFII